MSDGTALPLCANNGSSLLTHRLVGERDKASAGRQAERRSLGTPHGLAPWSADSSASRPKKNVFRLMGWSKLVISFWCDGLVRERLDRRRTANVAADVAAAIAIG